MSAWTQKSSGDDSEPRTHFQGIEVPPTRRIELLGTQRIPALAARGQVLPLGCPWPYGPPANHDSDGFSCCLEATPKNRKSPTSSAACSSRNLAVRPVDDVSRLDLWWWRNVWGLAVRIARHLSLSCVHIHHVHL